MGLWPSSLHIPCSLGSPGSEPEYPAGGGGTQLEIHCMSESHYKSPHIVLLETLNRQRCVVAGAFTLGMPSPI